MRLDIRLPLGLLFSAVGLLLAIFGLAGNKAVYERSLGININLWWGLVMLLFGIGMFVLGRRGERRSSNTGSSVGAPLGRGASEHE
jgi:multisubunit Na+/H+ antiporter MnhG subunit